MHGTDRPFSSHALTIPVVLLAVVASCAWTTPSSGADQRGTPPVAPSHLDIQPPRILSVVDDFELKFVDLVAAAKQPQAEQLLDQQLSRYPHAQQLVDELAADNVARAMFLNLWHRRELQVAQRMLFLKAACERSCFDVARASATFAAVGAIDPKTVSGRASLLMVRLDAIEPTLANWPSIKRDFGELQKIVGDNPHDPMLLWMLAIECRQWNHNKLGVGYYRELLSRWKPGPPLVHQTYANLLDNLKLYDEALAERRIAVAQAPTHWTFAGLANTLAHLHRFDESFAAHAEATRLNPHKPQYWVNWAIALNNDHRHEQAIDKCKRALALDRNFEDAYWNWARALKDQDKIPEALAKYRELQSIIPNSKRLKKRIAELEQQLPQ
jgi:tetratricopeptide (TPR) repeat protein